LTTRSAAREFADLDHARTFGWFAVTSAVLSTAFAFGLLRPLPAEPAALLAYFSEHLPVIALEAIGVLAWAVSSVPFVVALWYVTRGRGAGLALSAMILSSAGILLLTYGIRTFFGAMLAIGLASHQLGTTDAIHHAAIWRNLFFFLADPGLMAWGLGQFLFGRLTWKSALVPNWVAAVGMLGGAAGLLTDAVYQTAALAIIQIVCFAIWGFVFGIKLLRATRQSSNETAGTMSGAARRNN
jgi:hypothetical protein